MARATPPRDRFDEIPASDGRIGAHRAENPRMRAWVVLLWAIVATIVLVAVGIFGTLVATGRIALESTPTPTPTPTPQIAPVVDTTFQVVVLNATPEQGLANQLRDTIVGAGWNPDTVIAGDAGSEDFATTTVYYLNPADEAAALGLAQVVGGAEVAQSDAYATEGIRQLTLVIGLDRVAPAAPPTS